MRKPICPRCKADDITKDATASFDQETGQWVLAATFDAIQCDECGEESKSGPEWVDIVPS